MYAEEDSIHLKIVCYMHSWALLNHYLSLLDTLGHFEALLGPFGPFLGPFSYEEPFQKISAFSQHISRWGQEIIIHLC